MMNTTASAPIRSSADLATLAASVGEHLRLRGWSVATAESCTGGWIAKTLTDIAGSSAWFERGFVTYSNASKCELLGVPNTLLAEQGAVSGPVVRAMVAGALAHSRAQVALAVSGIAGPGGGSPDKPVGTVWFAWGHAGGVRVTRRVCFAGERDAVREQAVYTALFGLLDVLNRDVTPSAVRPPVG